MRQSLDLRSIKCNLQQITSKERVDTAPNCGFGAFKNALFSLGVAAGLVWTPYGGSIQYIECCITGKDNADRQGILTLTGQLGEVLEESAQIAMSWIKAHAIQLNFPDREAFGNYDVHIHLPSGGIQKDGPSAGRIL